MMDSDTFLTIKKESLGVYKEKGSRFFAFAYPVKNDIEIKEKLASLRKQYHDARHHCYAYVLGVDKTDFRANDDGEPNHSAGDPILGQIRSKNLSDILIVVVRYFGGTKLGVGGLITAYKTSALDALENAEIIEEVVTETIHVFFNYAQMSSVMRLIKEYDARIDQQQFEESCQLHITIRLKLRGELSDKLNQIHGVEAK